MNCCTHERAVKCHTLIERMWENYRKLCSSEEFHNRWVSIVQDLTGFNPSPIFYMFVTDTIMKLVIKKIFPVTDDESGNTVSSLEYHECNATRYTTGYVLRSLYKKVFRSANPLRSSLLQCLKDMFEGKIDKINVKTFDSCVGTNDVSQMPDSEEWTNSID